jgi:hypothetical protein
MSRAHKIFIRTHKRDSAFVYAVLEAHEGLVAYTTLPHAHHAQTRELQLLVPEPSLSDLEAVLNSLGAMVEILEGPPSKT